MAGNQTKIQNLVFRGIFDAVQESSMTAWSDVFRVSACFLKSC